jgi:preprotein translocase subunit SecE
MGFDATLFLSFPYIRWCMGRILRKKSTGRSKIKSVGNGADPASGKDTSSPPVKNTPAAPVVRQPKAPVNYPGKQYVDASIQFLREVRVELRKVTWPSRKQTIGSTVVVIVLVLMVSIFLGAVDMGLSSLVNVVLH